MDGYSQKFLMVSNYPALAGDYNNIAKLKYLKMVSTYPRSRGDYKHCPHCGGRGAVSNYPASAGDYNYYFFDGILVAGKQLPRLGGGL